MSFTISSYLIVHIKLYGFFFYNTATTEIYTLSLHDALPISPVEADAGLDRGRGPAARTVPRDAVERTARVAQSVRPAPRRVSASAPRSDANVSASCTSIPLARA